MGLEKILVVNSSSDESLTEFTDKIGEDLVTAGFEPLVVHYRGIPGVKLSDYSGVVLSPAAMGSPDDKAKVVCDRWQDRVDHAQDLLYCNSPLLGICAGHQMLGLLYGSEYIRNKEVEKGNNCQVDILTPEDVLFDGINRDTLSVKQQHSNSITLPDDFVLLATSDNCRVQIMRHSSRPLYGTQFHAEECPELFNNFLEIVNNY